MDGIKLWIINVGLKQMGPSFIRAAIGGLVGLLMAHAGLLAKLGIDYNSTTNDVTIHLTMLSAWLGVSGIGLITAFLTAGQHHVVATVTGAPQDGTHQRSTDADQGGTQ